MFGVLSKVPCVPSKDDSIQPNPWWYVLLSSSLINCHPWWLSLAYESMKVPSISALPPESSTKPSAV
jgi:hypothetical protein